MKRHLPPKPIRIRSADGFRAMLFDHFYPDPKKIRAEALAAEYVVDPMEAYPGFNSVYDSKDKSTLKRVAKILKSRVWWTRRPNGYFRYALKHHASYGDIHYDSWDWVGLVYLSLPRDCRGGTIFWRHKKTGFTRWPEHHPKGKKALHALQQQLIADGRDREKWEEVRQIEMKFNRLVLFTGHYFHSHASLFGSNMRNARLVQIYKFNVSPAPKDWIIAVDP